MAQETRNGGTSTFNNNNNGVDNRKKKVLIVFDIFCLLLGFGPTGQSRHYGNSSKAPIQPAQIPIWPLGAAQVSLRWSSCALILSRAGERPSIRDVLIG
ncbi:hypothetical protein D4764_07G0003580 [Takifugu flavidus]|uniref:Uncharacterized protein n=1 Tax=Takifugu flavidus TaxID=433684 RepID=A0A5C6MSB2_9TELE|nr:hypothetical protein D4764_07G0003580 [Takifugu flavidus]